MGHLLILIWIIVHEHSKPSTFTFLGFSNFTIFYQKNMFQFCFGKVNIIKGIDLSV